MRRCQIGFYGSRDKFENPTALIYKHNFGEPDKLVPFIMPVLEDFK